MFFGAESQVDPAKLVVDFAKDNEKLQIKGGFVDGQLPDPPTRLMALSQDSEQGRADRQMMRQHQLPG